MSEKDNVLLEIKERVVELEEVVTESEGFNVQNIKLQEEISIMNGEIVVMREKFLKIEFEL